MQIDALEAEQRSLRMRFSALKRELSSKRITGVSVELADRLREATRTLADKTSALKEQQREEKLQVCAWSSGVAVYAC